MSTSHQATSHCMLDIETLGRGPGAVVLSIGAVMFSPFKEGEIGQRFYGLPDLIDQERAGLRCEAATVQWWVEQEPEALRAAFGRGARTGLRKTLRDFAAWYGGNGGVALWANAPTFDCAIVRRAFEVAEVKVPWHWRDERDFRTLCRVVFGEERLTLPDGATLGLPKHHPLEDAYRQARVVQIAFTRMKGMRDGGNDGKSDGRDDDRRGVRGVRAGVGCRARHRRSS